MQAARPPRSERPAADGVASTRGAPCARRGSRGGRRRRASELPGGRRTARPPHGERPARGEEAAAAGAGGPRSSQAADGRAEAALLGRTERGAAVSLARRSSRMRTGMRIRQGQKCHLTFGV